MLWRARLPRAAQNATERPTALPSSCSCCLLPRPRCRVVGDRPAMTMKVFLGLPACAALPHWSKHSRPPRCSAAARLGFRGVPPRARRDQPAADSPDPRNHLSSELSVGISCCSCRPLPHRRAAAASSCVRACRHGRTALLCLGVPSPLTHRRHPCTAAGVPPLGCTTASTRARQPGCCAATSTAAFSVDVPGPSCRD